MDQKFTPKNNAINWNIRIRGQIYSKYTLICLILIKENLLSFLVLLIGFNLRKLIKNVKAFISFVRTFVLSFAQLLV